MEGGIGKVRIQGGEAKVRKVCKARAGVHCKGEGQGVGRTEDLNMGRGS